MLDLLRQHTTLFPRVDVKFDDGVADAPVLLHVAPHVDLLFSARHQRLRVVAARRLREPAPPLQLLYRGAVLSSVSASASASQQRPVGAGSRRGSEDVVLRRADISTHSGPRTRVTALRILASASYLMRMDLAAAAAVLGRARQRIDRERCGVWW